MRLSDRCPPAVRWALGPGLAAALALGGPGAQASAAAAALPHLTVSVSGPTMAAYGAPLTYVISVANVGNAPALGLVIFDALSPTALAPQVSTADGFACVWLAHARFTSDMLRCSGNLPAGASTTITITATAPSGDVVVVNAATVDPRHVPPGNPGATSALASTRVVRSLAPDLAIAATGAPDTVAAGGSATHVLTAQNLGAAGADGVVVRDTLPAGATLQSSSGDNGFTCSAAANVVTCAGGSLGPQSVATLQIVWSAPATAGGYTSTIVIDPDGVFGDSARLNNTAVVGTNVVAGGLPDLTVSAASPQSVPVGSEFVVSLSVGNKGAASADHVVVRDGFGRVELVSASGSNGFGCQPTHILLRGGMTGPLSGVECTNGSIPPGGVATITLRLRADLNPSTWTHTAVVDPGNVIAETDKLNNVVQGSVTFN